MPYNSVNPFSTSSSVNALPLLKESMPFNNSASSSARDKEEISTGLRSGILISKGIPCNSTIWLYNIWIALEGEIPSFSITASAFSFSCVLILAYTGDVFAI